MKIYDLSPPIDAAIPVWPGDTPFATRLTWRLADGDSVNLSAIESTPHLGSHADAPFHTEADGAGIGEMPLAPYLGPCRVVAVPRQRGRLAAASRRAAPPGGRRRRAVDPADPPRLLLKTASIADRSASRSASPPCRRRSPTTSPPPARCSSASTRRRSTPSTRPTCRPTTASPPAASPTSKGLVLDAVPPGLYELIALPLRLAGLDASPVRAVLRELVRERRPCRRRIPRPISGSAAGCAPPRLPPWTRKPRHRDPSPAAPPRDAERLPGVRLLLRGGVRDRGEDHRHLLPPDLPRQEAAAGERRLLPRAARRPARRLPAVPPLPSAARRRGGAGVAAAAARGGGGRPGGGVVRRRAAPPRPRRRSACAAGSRRTTG